jgi:hypothetical protein
MIISLVIQEFKMTTIDTTPTTSSADDEMAQKLADAVKSIAHLSGIRVELTGCWIWVSGDTKPVKDDLKAAGFKWAHKKGQWYFAGRRSTSRGGKDMSYIRFKYGSTILKADD